MFRFLRKFFKKKVIGIDIGTDSIKIVEVSLSAQWKKIENYARAPSRLIAQEPLLKTNSEGGLAFADHIALAIRKILKEARIKTKKAVFLLPDFLTFAAYFEIPSMPQNEIAGAVYFNASQYLTLPISEVTLDWVAAPSITGDKAPIKIFLIAVPNKIIASYRQIAKMAGLDMRAVESEIFSLARIFSRPQKNTVCVLDLGAKTSTINIAQGGFLKRSYSIDFGSQKMTSFIASATKLDPAIAEKMQQEEGLLSKNSQMINAIKTSLDEYIAEIKKITADFLAHEQVQISEVLLTGGLANMPGLIAYLQEKLSMPTKKPNCFEGFFYSRILKSHLQELSPIFACAVGICLSMLDE